MSRIGMICVFFSLVGVVSLSDIKAADAETMMQTVRYSYQKWSRVEPVRYVLVPTPTRLAKGDFAEKTRKLMRLLVTAKQGTYGNARLAFQKDYKTNPVVYVWLDKSKASYHPIVMAETVYTFTENGAKRVIFPEVKPAGMVRDDVPFAAYILTIPLWQALPPANFNAATVTLPDGQSMASELAIDRLRKGDKALLNALWSYLKKGDASAIAATKAAIFLKLDGLNDRLIPLLQSANTALRKLAIEGLKGVDMPQVNKALRSVVDDDPDPALKDLAAGILSSSSDPQFAAAAQYHALKSKDPEIVMAAAKALGSSKLSEASKQLLDMITHEDHRVRATVLDSLAERGDYAALVNELNGSRVSKEIRLEIAQALAKGADKNSVFEAICFISAYGKDEDSLTATRKLGSFDKTKSYKTLGSALRHKESAVRRAAANSLAKLGKVDGLGHLAKGDISDPESGETIREAIRKIFAKQSLDYVMKATKTNKGILKRLAVSTLGDFVKSGKGKRSRKKILASLRSLAKSSDANIRAASVRSLGIMGGEDIRSDIMSLAADSSIEVTRAVAAALGAFPGPKTTSLLLKHIGAEDPKVIANAADSLGRLKIREATTPISEQMNHKSVVVRRAATQALVLIGGTLKQRKPLLSLFGNRLFDSDGQVRLAAVRGLRLVKDARTVTALGALLQDPLIPVRIATLDAMADTGHVSAVTPIVGQLEDEDKVIRKAALKAIEKLGKKEANPFLETYLTKEKDSELSALAKKVKQSL
ncbi:MAG: HEAT repeat domain-containing protein [Myxococcota bacterium]|nr:HEAT repeat domain-containing protein [Myxococcota bacterium]